LVGAPVINHNDLIILEIFGQKNVDAIYTSSEIFFLVERRQDDRDAFIDHGL
jgi:hypothetical protein